MDEERRTPSPGAARRPPAGRGAHGGPDPESQELPGKQSEEIRE
ncbi:MULTISPECIES: hypothetical protein [Actinomycetes]|nr:MULTISPECIES: hypothetical protein [Actinomycetes]